MAWVAFDRAVKSVQEFGLDGPVERWKRRREEIRREVLERSWDPVRGTFTQSYGSQALDAALLLMPMVGFLPATDERMSSTVAAIERELMRDGFVQRYPSEIADDGLPPGEGAFLPCTFWLVDNLVLQGRTEDATSLLERLLALGNDVGLFAEEYDAEAGRQVGNFPQAFTHMGLVNAALHLEAAMR